MAMTATVSGPGAFGESSLHKRIGGAANSVLILGVALLIVGIAALVFPMVTTLVGTIFVGWLLIFWGLVSVFGAFSIRGTGPFFGALLFGLLSLAAGIFMLAQPTGGALAITLA